MPAEQERARERSPMDGTSPKSVLRDYTETILVCVIFVLFARAFVFQQSKIPTGSMEDTLLPGDYILVDRMQYAPVSFAWESRLLPGRPVARGDIIVFRYPAAPEVDYIKRVIGLPGDTVEVRNQRVWVNGEALDEPYVAAAYRAGYYPEAPRLTVEPGHYFVMGDHRNDSLDSRAWGLVPASHIKGRAVLIWWSFPEDDGAHPTVSQRLKAWGGKIVGFFPRTRWNRCLKRITEDSPREGNPMGSRTGFSDHRDEQAPTHTKGVVREYVEVILVCVIFILFARHFVFQQSEIPSGSMEDTILVGDYILVNRWAYAPVSFEWERALFPSREVRRGDVIVFKQPQTPERDYIKRVIGLPGDTVQVTRAGEVFVNGDPLIEPYVNPLYAETKPYPPTRVEPGKYFVMGDHRNLSSDSREWGHASIDLIKGKAFIVLLSTQPRSSEGRPSEQVTLRSLGVKMYKLVFHSRWDRALRRIH